MELNLFMTDHLKRRWSPGSVDCLLTLADWFIHRGFNDAAEHLRGTYSDDAGFRSIIAKCGGAVETVESCAERIGLSRVETPFSGSIAVIGSARDIHKQFGVIFDGERWLLRLEDRFAPMIAKPLVMWDKV